MAKKTIYPNFNQDKYTELMLAQPNLNAPLCSEFIEKSNELGLTFITKPKDLEHSIFLINQEQKIEGVAGLLEQGEFFLAPQGSYGLAYDCLKRITELSGIEFNEDVAQLFVDQDNTPKEVMLHQLSVSFDNFCTKYEKANPAKLQEDPGFITMRNHLCLAFKETEKGDEFVIIPHYDFAFADQKYDFQYTSGYHKLINDVASLNNKKFFLSQQFVNKKALKNKLIDFIDVGLDVQYETKGIFFEFSKKLKDPNFIKEQQAYYPNLICKNGNKQENQEANSALQELKSYTKEHKLVASRTAKNKLTLSFYKR